MKYLLSCGLLALVAVASAQTTTPATAPADDFTHNLDNWVAECEKPATVRVKDGILSIDAPAGVTLWYKPKLTGPLEISYDARAVKANGANDRVSDLNCFWMATDTRSPDDLFATKRSGKFSDYNQLRCYYVGLGGNDNSTTRFRRYIGDTVDRPLLPQNDLRDAGDMLKPNEWQTIRLVADGHVIQYFRDGKKLFELNDPEPYAAGHFAFRTTRSHLEFRNFVVRSLKGGG